MTSVKKSVQFFILMINCNVLLGKFIPTKHLDRLTFDVTERLSKEFVKRSDQPVTSIIVRSDEDDYFLVSSDIQRIISGKPMKVCWFHSKEHVFKGIYLSKYKGMPVSIQHFHQKFLKTPDALGHGTNKVMGNNLYWNLKCQIGTALVYGFLTSH